MLMSAVVGSASCAGKSEHLTPRASGAAGTGASGTAGTAGVVGTAGEAGASGVAAGCELPADLVCTGYQVAPGCSCNPALVTGDKDCANTAQLNCLCMMPAPDMTEGTMGCVPENVAWNYDSIVCSCDTSAPLTPYDCPHTQQFTCNGLTPFLEGCICDLDAPLSAADCPAAERPFGCQGLSPEAGCGCFSTMR